MCGLVAMWFTLAVKGKERRVSVEQVDLMARVENNKGRRITTNYDSLNAPGLLLRVVGAGVRDYVHGCNILQYSTNLEHHNGLLAVRLAWCLRLEGWEEPICSRPR